MNLNDCDYLTNRLLVRDWYSTGEGDRNRFDLAGIVMSLLTEPVTRSLPPEWQAGLPSGQATRWISSRDSDDTVGRVLQWIAERDSEGVMLLAVDRISSNPVGLVILFLAEENGIPDIRLGYLVGEYAWGRGLATEMVAGFVNWCRAQSFRGTISAGVAPSNLSSRRVLEKTGFQMEDADFSSETEFVYRQRLD